MEIVGATNDGYTTYSRADVAERKSEFDTDLFMKLMTTQLNHQDPFEPMSNQELYDNIAKMANIDSSKKLTDTIEAFQSSIGNANAASYLGKEVVSQSLATGDLVSGKVFKVSFRSGDTILHVRDDLSGMDVETSAGALKEVSG